VIRFTADTNIYISALNFHGVPEEVLNLAHTDRVRLAVSDAILLELSRTLRIKFA
jgi:predicted nucleic acid-binding protein